MNILKLIRPLILSVFMISTMMGIAKAQTASMSTAINTFVPGQDIYCDGTYALVDTSQISSANENLHLCPRIPETGSLGASGTLTDGDNTALSAVVDWVLVELRAVDNTEGSTTVANADGSTVIARKPAFLLSNGRVVDAELYAEATDKDPASCTGLTAHANCPDVVFEQGDVATEVDTNDLYIVIRHRNHVDIISNENVAEVAGESGVYAHDFSDAETKARGGSSALVNITKDGATAFAMYGGDADANGNVNLDDYNSAQIDSIRASQQGYIYADTDMNTNANLDDYNKLVRDNARSSRGTQVP